MAPLFNWWPHFLYVILYVCYYQTKMVRDKLHFLWAEALLFKLEGYFCLCDKMWKFLIIFYLSLFVGLSSYYFWIILWKNLLIFNNFSFAFLFSGECSNKECQYLHIDPESKIKDCPWYDRGFCKHGGLIEQAILDIRELKKQRREGLQLSIDHNTDVHYHVKHRLYVPWTSS